jgi:DNA-binding CsgD family transcriptional regulator
MPGRGIHGAAVGWRVHEARFVRGAMTRVRTRNESEWLELVATLFAAPLVELPDEQIALQLHASFGLVACSFNDVAPEHVATARLWPADEQLGGLRGEMGRWAAERGPREHPLLRYYLRTGRREPLQVADVPRAIAGTRVRANWSDVGRAIGCPSQLALPLRLGPARHRAFVLGRSDVFTPGELRLGHLLWQLLTALDRQVQEYARLTPELDVAAALRLTPREATVLGLLVDGLTAAAIGRRLGIAERTVQKHLEHVYGKLGVADRLTAVLRAQHLGLLPALTRA